MKEHGLWSRSIYILLFQLQGLAKYPTGARGHVGERETPSYHWSCHEVTHQSGLILLAPTDLSCGLSPRPLLSS